MHLMLFSNLSFVSYREAQKGQKGGQIDAILYTGQFAFSEFIYVHVYKPGMHVGLNLAVIFAIYFKITL